MLLLADMTALVAGKMALLLLLALLASLWLWPAGQKIDAAPTPATIKPMAMSETLAPRATRLQPGTEFSRISTVIRASGQRLQSVHGATASAARHIDNAEMALNRLIREVSAVMPEALTPTVVPRRILPA